MPLWAVRSRRRGQSAYRGLGPFRRANETPSAAYRSNPLALS